MTARIGIRQQHKKIETRNAGYKETMYDEEIKRSNAYYEYSSRKFAQQNEERHRIEVDSLLEINHQQRLIIQEKESRKSRKHKRDFMENMALLMVIMVSGMLGYVLLMAISLMIRIVENF